MQPNLKKILRALSLDLRHTLEGFYDNTGVFHPGDMETRLNALGVWRDRPAKPLDELPHLTPEDKAARQVIDAYIAYRAEAEVPRTDAVAEFVREAAYNWANRLLALRCEEARGLVDEVILQKEIYGGHSLAHNRLARKNPPACAGPDEGLFAVLLQEFENRARELPELFAPASPAIALRPSLPALKRCLALLSGTQKAGGQEAATDEVFTASDALGWAYQYWNTEEKDRVFEKVRTQKGAKITGADIIPATQLYTEPYMVKFLVQNSLGATWMGMHPKSKLSESWEYYVKDADRALLELKPIQEITLLDPALGSGHFHLEAFDLFFPMYREEHQDWSAAQIAAAILNHNLYGIDIDERAVQIAAAALWMKAKEFAPDLQPEALTSFHQHLVATNIRLPKGKNHLKAFLTKHPEAIPLQSALEAIFEGLENVHELGSLVQIEEPVEKELRYLREKYESTKKLGIQANLFEPTVVQGELPLGVESYEHWKAKTLAQLEQHFTEESEAAEVVQSFFGVSAQKGLALFELLSQRYNEVTANPPYMGSKNMGAIQKKYLERHYKDSKRDLYAAFIQRCNGVVFPTGHVAMITQQSWMFLNQFTKLRQAILRSSSIETIVHLGRYAFSEIGNAAVQPAMFIFALINKRANHEITFFRLHAPRPSDEQESLLRASINNKVPGILYRREQKLFDSIEDSPLSYWLPISILENFSLYPLRKILTAKVGIQTGDTSRFLRYFWEAPNNVEWRLYSKGGKTKRWSGVIDRCIRWWNFPSNICPPFFASSPDPILFANQSLTYTMAGNSVMAARFKPESIVTDMALWDFAWNGHIWW